MKIVFMGTPDFAVPCLEAVLDAGHEVAAVFCQPDRPSGRGYKLIPCPVKRLAEERSIPVCQPDSLKDGAGLEILKKYAPEAVAVVAYGRILPPDMLEYPKYGCINIHGSLLPKYRGAAPIQRAVINGDEKSGVTSMYMARGCDTGDMILKRETPILPDETAGGLFDRLAPMGAELLVETLELIEKGEAPRIPQDESEATLAPMLTKEEGLVDWSKDAGSICCLIRGMDPWPAACTTVNGTTLKLFCPSFERVMHGVPAGTLVGVKKSGEMSVAVRDGTVNIAAVQASGTRRMAAADYLRGHPIAAGTVFGRD